eukprot:TCALIF_06236-PB protein Name:"Similar to TPX2 Targeting protein for Xklp2 homolog (Patiria pectinifera)" AED:0.07 eAED:0.05 QI:246/0.66/0.57/1/1/1/7/271/703
MAQRRPEDGPLETATGFDCEYNAPQFFDFCELGAVAEDGGVEAGHPADREEAEKYFRSDSQAMDLPTPTDSKPSAETVENVSPTGLEAEEPAGGVSAVTRTNPLVEAMRKYESPRRKSIKEAVTKTLEEAAVFSPKMKAPPARRSGTPNVALTSLDSAKSAAIKKAPSPAYQRWRKVVNAVTPEVLRHARELGKRNKQAKAMTGPNSGSNANTNGLPLAATTSTLANKAKVNEASKSQSSKSATTSTSSSSSSYSLRVTRPEPFRFATDHRNKQQVQPQHSQLPTEASKMREPMRAKVGQVDFSKMLRSYDQHHEDSRGRSKVKAQVTRPQPFTFGGRSRRANSCEPTPTKRRRETSLEDDAAQPQAKMSHTTLGGGSSDSLRNTKPHPFSFVDRDLARVKDKYDQIKQESQVFFNMSKAKSGQNLDLETEFQKTNYFTKSLRSYPSNEAMPDPNRLSQGGEVITDRVVRAKPMPHFGVPVRLPCANKKATAAQPFSFEDRDQQTLTKKREKIDKILEQEKKEREFKANPMPNLNKPVGLPIKEVILPTEAKPFHHEIEKRVENRIQKWQKGVEEELRKQQEAALFKARPAKVLYQEPFRPEHHDKPMTEISNFELHSDRRAREREVFELEKKRKEADLESMKRQLEERRRLEHEEEVRRLRHEAVHKAQPVRSYKGIKIQPSDKPLTNPRSPNFSNKTRSDL